VVLIAIGVLGVLRWVRRGDAPATEKEAAPEPAAVRASPPRFTPAPATNAAAMPPAPDDVYRLVSEANALAATGRLVEARSLYLEALKARPDGQVASGIESRIGSVNVALVVSPREMPEKTRYVIQSGDALQKIARTFNVTVDLLQAAHGITNPSRLRVGTTLWILTGKFAIRVELSRNVLVLSLNGDFFKRYAVGTGKGGKTPTGRFTIFEKAVNPTWWPQGREVPFGHPDNILGTRWMGIKPTGDTPPVRGYGIHGTWDDGSIGKSESAGCIRMHNSDVEELYMLVPTGTSVEIVD
jgi:lipoprotein-anchoring transpeptidase ErfK/SrfK